MFELSVIRPLFKGPQRVRITQSWFSLAFIFRRLHNIYMIKSD